MPTFVLSGAHVGAKFGIFDTTQLINYAENKLLGAAEVIPTPLIKGGTFYDFPYLSSISLTVEGGVRQIQAIGLQNLAALEEEGIGLQDVSIECMVQPIPAMEKIFSLFKRRAEFYNHFPFVAIRAGAKGVYYFGNPSGFGNALIDVWACVPRSLTFNQPAGNPATLRLSLGGGYIHAEIPYTQPFSISYRIDKGILNIFEGVIKLYNTQNQRILPEFPLLVSSFSMDIRNNINPYHTFLQDTFTQSKFIKAVRMWRALMDAIQIVEGNFTVLTIHNEITLLNINQLTQVAKMEIEYYPFVGSSYPGSPPTNPEMKITLYNVKFTRSSTNITPDGALQWTTNFMTSNPEGESWDFYVAQ